MRVVVAPDCFGGTLTAPQAAAAIAQGWAAERPTDVVDRVPQSDGGPGFVDVVLEGARIGGIEHQTIAVTVPGPLGIPTPAQVVLVSAPAGAHAFVESAQACGLHLLQSGPTPESAVAATTRGVGELLLAALDAGARRITVGLGGSATTDGGRGLASAFGDQSRAVAALRRTALIAATDVSSPLLGPDGAAAVFGPQKGATAAVLPQLEARLAQQAVLWEAASGRDVRALGGAGAAGGLGAALLAMGATQASGAEVSAVATGLDRLISGADLVITGEGRLDIQSLAGKLPVAVAARAARGFVPTIALAGQVCIDPDVARSVGISGMYSLTEHAGSRMAAMDNAHAELIQLAAAVARQVTLRGRGVWAG